MHKRGDKQSAVVSQVSSVRPGDVASVDGSTSRIVRMTYR